VTRLNYEFLVDFEFFLKTQKRCAHNTVMGYVKKVKKIARQCVAMDLLDKDPFMAFKVTIRDVQRNLLTQDELDLLRLKSFSIVRIGVVRDIFLFCCYTGLSFSDVEKVDRSEIVKGSDGNYWIYTTRTKTCSASRISLLPAAEQILQKYASDPYCKQTNRALPVLSNQKMNST